MRLKLKLTEMKQAEAQFVSLVARGANRIPFRIVKSAEDTNMIDLSKPSNILKAAKKTEPVAPQVSALVLSAEIQKSEKYEQIKTALAENGFQVEKAETQEDGSVMFAQIENPLEDAEIVRVNETMLVIVKGFCPYSGHLKGFQEIVGAEGYYDGLNSATRALQQAMGQAMQDAESPVVAAQKAASVLDDFKTYVTTMVKNLPEAAFKAEQIVDAVMAAKADPGVEEVTQETTETTETTEVVDKGMQRPEGMSQEDWDAKSEDEKKSYLAKKEDPTEVQKSEEGQDDENLVRKVADTVLSALKGELQVLAGLAEKLEGISKANAELADRVEEVANTAADAVKKADESKQVLGTTVNIAAPSGDKVIGQPVAKADGDPRTGCFDTAYLRRN